VYKIFNVFPFIFINDNNNIKMIDSRNLWDINDKDLSKINMDYQFVFNQIIKNFKFGIAMYIKLIDIFKSKNHNKLHSVYSDNKLGKKNMLLRGDIIQKYFSSPYPNLQSDSTFKKEFFRDGLVLKNDDYTFKDMFGDKAYNSAIQMKEDYDFIMFHFNMYQEEMKKFEALLDECPICYDSTTKEYDIKIQLECGHWFHKGCILEWRNKRNECPMCKKQIRI